MINLQIRGVAVSALAIAFVLSQASAFAAPAPVLTLELAGGKSATVRANGIVEIFSKDRRTVETRLLQPVLHPDAVDSVNLPNRPDVIEQLTRPYAHRPYIPGRLIVVYREGIYAPRDVISIDRTAASTNATVLTNDAHVNHMLAAIGVERSERLFRQVNRSLLEQLRSRSSAGSAMLDFANAYRLQIAASSVPDAVALLAKSPEIAYVSPDWRISPMHTPSIHLASRVMASADARARSMAWRPRLESGGIAPQADGLPANYVLASSGQSLFNAPSTGAAAAYDEVETRFHQLPGEGETITNVSLGDLDDVSVAKKLNDPCSGMVQNYGPTTIVRSGQRYLDFPSMPLIPTFTADISGELSGSAEVCGVDPTLGEVGLDFSMMSPLPHDRQRPGELGNGLTDLLGVAPGASYRLVVPASSTPATSDLDGAMLAAALQTPTPNVITASLGMGFDEYGFPSRYFEEDPLTESLVTAIVHQYGIVVCISAGDGTRLFTNAAIGPSGGSVPTNVVSSAAQLTSVNDDQLSTIPSGVFDSGAIAVGGTTLDDLFANPPQYASAGQAIAQHAYPETRWTGFTSFSSGFGSRVNVSAPADNVLSFEHDTMSPTADGVDVVIAGGTSASAPETAAAAAVVLQVARLTGHPFADALAVRKFLERTATDVPPVPQADTTIAVGPQIDLRAAVEALLAEAGVRSSVRVPRVAVEQRRDYGNLDGVFESDTDPANIDLQENLDRLAWITIAPDWEFVPKNATYRLSVEGKGRAPLAVTAWARLLPSTILHVAGLPLISTSSRTAHLVYDVEAGGKIIATAPVTLTFGPTITTTPRVLAPSIPAVVTGKMIPVRYDYTDASAVVTPQLVVSEPGRIDPDTGPIFHPAYTAPLTQGKGTIDVPVSALQGSGIYGIGIELNPISKTYSDFAFTRVAAGGADRPQAPLLSSNGSTPGHLLQIPYGASVQVRYDVKNVTGATGAELEISAAGPGAHGQYNAFNNPNGSIRDRNGIDAGSVYFAPLSSTSGTVTLDTAKILYPTLFHTIRVIPMRAGVAAGEGGDVSTLTMHGVLPTDGGGVAGGWGIDANGNDGFVISTQQSASGVASSIQTFDQPTNQVVHTIASQTQPFGYYFTLGWGMWGKDVGLAGYYDLNPSNGDFTQTFNIVKHDARRFGTAWTPPYQGFPTLFQVLEGAANNVSDTGAFLVYNNISGTFDVFTSNLTTGTFSPAYSLAGALTGMQLGQVDAIAENTSTNTAVLPAHDGLNENGTTTMILTNLTTGAVTSFNSSLGSGANYGVAVDSATNKAVVTTNLDYGVTFYDLAKQTGKEILLDGFYGLYPTIDSHAGIVLVEQTVAPDFQINNNSLSNIYEYDESGNLLKTISRFDFYALANPIAENNIQLNPANRIGYTSGLGDLQLAPFAY